MDHVGQLITLVECMYGHRMCELGGNEDTKDTGSRNVTNNRK